MTVGTIYIISNGKQSCKYLCIFSGLGGWNLKRLVLPKTKADGSRFPETITINIGASTVPEKKKKK